MWSLQDHLGTILIYFKWCHGRYHHHSWGFWLLWIFYYYILVMRILGGLFSKTISWQSWRHQNQRKKQQWYLHSLINKHWKWVCKCEVLCVKLVGNSSIIALNYILNSFHTCVMHMCHLNLNLVFWSEGRIFDNLILLQCCKCQAHLKTLEYIMFNNQLLN